MGSPRQVATIHSIHRYLVKSMAGETVKRARLTEAGLLGDRLYAFESSRAPRGMHRVTGRERQALLGYQPELREEGRIDVIVPTGERLAIDSPAMLAYLHGQSLEVSEAGSDFVLTKATTSQTDVRPLSLISIQTIERLSAAIGEPLEPRRFRATLLLDMQDGPFAEDRLVGSLLRLGGSATIQIRERVPRCRFITYDPENPASAPLFPLMKLLDRDHDGRAGVYATVRLPGPIAAEDPVWLAEGD